VHVLGLCASGKPAPLSVQGDSASAVRELLTFLCVIDHGSFGLGIGVAGLDMGIGHTESSLTNLR
jgi:hypothetical protein